MVRQCGRASVFCNRSLTYLIKDSFEPFTYRESAYEIHKILHHVTVAR